VKVHELRCTPRPGDKFYKWEDFPFLTGLALDWIQGKAADPALRDHTLLLGTRVPNEVALGIGIRAGRQSCTGWPPELWPVIWKPNKGPLVMTRLNLGTDGSAG
jgi:hypothetical protein